MKTSGTFRRALKERHCLVPNHGFFQWQRDGKAKIPYRLKLADTEIAFFPGIWDRWEGAHKGRPAALISFANLTCAPNALVAPFHDRMPAILRPEGYQTWVFGDAETAMKVAGPYPAQVMTAQQLGPAINSSCNDSVNLLTVRA